MKRRNLLKFLPLSIFPLVSSEAGVLKSSPSDHSAPLNIPDSGSSRIPDEKLWLVGEVYDYSETKKWGFVGIFNNIEGANEVCMNGNHFIAPVVLNDNFNDVDYWPGGCFFPNQYSESKSLDDLKNRHEFVFNRVSNVRPIDTRLVK